MNTNVQADTFSIGLVATMEKVTVSTVINLLPNRHITHVDTVCLSLFQLSLNGHSISAINPENSLMGGMATSVMA
jgi:hypothetical protein